MGRLFLGSAFAFSFGEEQFGSCRVCNVIDTWCYQHELTVTICGSTSSRRQQRIRMQSFIRLAAWHNNSSNAISFLRRPVTIQTYIASHQESKTAIHTSCILLPCSKPYASHAFLLLLGHARRQSPTSQCHCPQNLTQSAKKTVKVEIITNIRIASFPTTTVAKQRALCTFLLQ